MVAPRQMTSFLGSGVGGVAADLDKFKATYVLSSDLSRNESDIYRHCGITFFGGWAGCCFGLLLC